MALDWREGLKGALMSPEQFNKYQDRKYESQKTQSQREFDLRKIYLQDELQTNRGLALEEKKHGYRKSERQESRSQKMDDNIYNRYDMSKEQYEQRGQMPHWVPRGAEQKYQAAKQYYSDDEIKNFLRV